MSQPLRVPRVKRIYSRWAADETMEDYALRFTAFGVRRFSAGRIANTAIGAVSFLALEAIGGTITLAFGFTNAAAAILVTCTLIFLAGVPICYHAAKAGVDIDLLSRGAGFGYLGSTITSLIYASFTFIFFAIEAAIIATALELALGLPRSAGYILASVVVIPLVLYGVTFISRFHAWTQPLWIVLQLLPFVYIALNERESVKAWTGFTGLFGDAAGGFSLSAFGAASAVLFALMAQIGEQVDFLRFLPRAEDIGRGRWWSALLGAGPGWVVFGALKFFAGSYLAYYAFSAGIEFASASDPVEMYHAIFGAMVPSAELALALTCIFTIICQLKINVTNAYAGSIAWSNFFSRLTHNHPGRVVWLVFNVMIGLFLMEFGMYRAFESILGIYAILAVAWVSALVADLVINRPLGLAPQRIEFRRAHLYDINPVGFGAMTAGIVASGAAHTGLFGESAAALYSYIAILVPLVTSPLLAFATKGRFYIAREPDRETVENGHKVCCICEYPFDGEDMAHCPVYSGPICSLCCSLDARCGDACKPNAHLSDQIRSAVYAIGGHKPWLERAMKSTLVRFLAIMTLVSLLLAAIFLFVSIDRQLNGGHSSEAAASILPQLFVIVVIASGVVVWLFVLSQDSHRRAEEEVQRHTKLLMDEIAAHRETDLALKQAREVAEKANSAKSRYVVGLSHELRSPLNSILGYAQILERRAEPNSPVHTAASTIKRSGDHLSMMIEGLLDISRIEAGKLEIFRHKVALKPLLDQLVDMFALQARTKDVRFRFEASPYLPDYVWTDSKRLRQILINLLSNAVKFTDKGHVRFALTYRSGVATFVVEDSGFGIAEEDLERIFQPFERAGTKGDGDQPAGTGLGLSITRLLVDIMGGDLSVRSEVGTGTTFTLRILLSSVHDGEEVQVTKPIPIGYRGNRRSVLVADDNLAHRRLIREFLEPIGFEVIEAINGRSAISAAAISPIDIALLDVSMPDLSGWDVARRIRSGPNDIRIVMVSAEAGAERNRPDYRPLHDDYLTKPFLLPDLIERIGTHLNLEWDNENQQDVWLKRSEDWYWPPAERLLELETLAKADLMRSVGGALRQLEHDHPQTSDFCAAMRDLAERSRRQTIIDILSARKLEVGHDVSSPV
ncbi:ATP-binding protein [Fulvimarina sp. MAC8]|uniref:ATP-binding protein n=1 Tax=Fulvimarina sp. MAC8 TaxID=3162874 RepID=UPI0032ED91DB